MSDPDPLASAQGPLPPEPPVEVVVGVEDQPPRDPFWTWGDLFVFLFLLIPCFVLSALITAGVFKLLHLKPHNELVTAIPAQFLGYGFALAGLWMLLKTRYHAPLWRSLGWIWQGAMVIPMAAGGVALAIGVALTSVLLKTKPVKSPMEELLNDPVSAMSLAFFAVTLGPVCEELLFRGFLQPLAVRSFGLWLGILTAALPFALLHGPQYMWSWQHVLLILVAGCVFGLTRYKTRSTALAACMHAGYNFTFFALVIFQRGIL
jgi:uncharacterized protein